MHKTRPGGSTDRNGVWRSDLVYPGRSEIPSGTVGTIEPAWKAIFSVLGKRNRCGNADPNRNVRKSPILS